MTFINGPVGLSQRIEVTVLSISKFGRLQLQSNDVITSLVRNRLKNI